MDARGHETQNSPTDRIKPDDVFEREIKPGEIHVYRLKLTTRDYLQASLEQRGVNVALRLIAPDSKELADVDIQKFRQGIERLYWLTDASGDFQIEVRSLEKDLSGTYQLRLEAVRTASNIDQLRVRALNLYWEGLRLGAQRDAESRGKAIETYQQASKLFSAAGDKWGEAAALHKIGSVNSDLRQWQKAIDYLDQALPLYLAAGEQQGEASALTDKGALFGDDHSELFDMAKASELYGRALPIARTIGDKELEGRILFNTAKLYGRPTGDWRKAIDLYQNAVAPGRASGNLKIVAGALNNMAMAYFDNGEPYKALEIFDEALVTVRTMGDRQNEAGYLHNAAMVLYSVGDVQNALDVLDQAEVIVRNEKLSFIEPYTRHLKGQMFSALGEHERAIESYQQGLLLVRQFGIRDGERSFLMNIGEAQLRAGDYEKARDAFEQAMHVKIPGAPGLDPEILIRIADVNLASGDGQKALEQLQQAMPLFRETQNRAKGSALEILGRAYLKLNEPAKALTAFNEASSSPVPLNLVDGTRLLVDIARAQKRLGNLTEARTKTEEALTKIESSRSNLVSPELRASYFATQQETFYFYVDLLMDLHKQQPQAGFDHMALEASEARRARSLLEFLNAAHANIRQGVDAQLIDQERVLGQRLNAKQQFRLRLLGGSHTEKQVAAIDNDVNALLADYQSAQDRIRKVSSHYSALTQPQRLSANEIRGLLEPNTLLLEYSLGPERSYLWATTPESVSTYELPKRTEIDTAARRLYGMLTSRQPLRGETQQQYLVRVKEADAQYEREATALGQMLLAPVADLLGKKRLLIVADGSLGYLPFASLPSPAPGQPRRALITQHEIVYLPSASTLAVLRREIAGRPSAPKAVAVLADPVFDRRDDRVSRQSTTPVNAKEKPVATDIAAQALRDAGLLEEGLPLTRLPFSRQEAEAIIALAPPGETLKALGFNANLDTAISPELSRFRIVHFATHALVNPEHPYLSGLLLSLVDEQGMPQDGFLSLNQIYNLNLPADLVVLSACQTAKGKEVKGEGVIGLTRAFMYAGAPRVVASLWKVDDAATAEISKRFYRGILKEGLRPAAALQAAQLEMSRHKLWNSPYYWAGFVLQGEPN